MDTARDEAQKEVKVWLDDLEAEQDRLNGWEKNFVANLQDYWMTRGKLTTGQYDKLKEVYARYF